MKICGLTADDKFNSVEKLLKELYQHKEKKTKRDVFYYFPMAETLQSEEFGKILIPRDFTLAHITILIEGEGSGLVKCAMAHQRSDVTDEKNFTVIPNQLRIVSFDLPVKMGSIIKMRIVDVKPEGEEPLKILKATMTYSFKVMTKSED